MYYEIPYADPITENIDLYLRSWDDLMRQRIRLNNRAVDKVSGEVRSEFLGDMADIIQTSENKVRRRLEGLIRDHPMADWLEEAKTRGARVATVLAMIRNPHRFPGQKCSEGHYMLPTFEAGEPCPCAAEVESRGDDPKPCPGAVQEPRPHTGCRSLWHMMGLYPVTTKKGEERLATYRKGVQGSHNRKVKTAVLMPQGIAQQFYMQGSRYAEPYYDAKARLADKHPDRAPGWLDATARVIAAKEWAGDLLMEWKERVPLRSAETSSEIETSSGEPSVVVVKGEKPGLSERMLVGV